MTPRQHTFTLNTGLDEMPGLAACFELDVKYDMDTDGLTAFINDISIIDSNNLPHTATWLLEHPKANSLIYRAIYEHELNDCINRRQRSAELRRELADADC